VKVVRLVGQADIPVTPAIQRLLNVLIGGRVSMVGWGDDGAESASVEVWDEGMVEVSVVEAEEKKKP
jgi:hypothetical protein